ncbi:testis-expressed protein 19 [Myotis yumanensis]|uniref:testis-expressed protein 19 n=1 Tax=Myotis yumanensis TaxID=159337 RepID=UPI0038D3A786
MCSPGSERPGREGVSQLRAFWLYQLQQENQLTICFPCFKLLFLSFKEALEAGGWEEEDWDPEPAQHPGAGPEEGPSQGMGPGGWQGLDQPEQGGLGDWGSDTLASDPDESEELGLMPTELTPQNAAPLGLGPEHADWTQSLPWRFGGVPTWSHWPSPYVLPQSFPQEILPPGEPMLLELVAAREVDLALADTWLLRLPAMAMVGGSDGTCLRHMSPRWVRRTPEPRWVLLLEPNDRCVLRLQSPVPGQDLSPWQLSVLQSCPTGHGAQLVPAGTALLMWGFRVLSYSPCNKTEAEEGDAASGPEASPQGQGPGFTGTGRWGARESLGPEGAPLFPAPRPEARVTTRDWEGQAAAPPPQPGQLLAGDGDGDLGLWWEDGAWPRDCPVLSGEQHPCPAGNAHRVGV